MNNLFSRKAYVNLLIMSVLFVSFVAVPFVMFIEPAQGQTVLEHKWTRWGTGSTVAGALIADVRDDYDGEEVFVVGVGRATALTGLDENNNGVGDLLWQRTDLSEIWYWSQPQMADLDLDGNLELIIPYGEWPPGGNGLYVLNAEDGSNHWPHSRTQGKLGGTSYVGSPVIGDIDGDGYPTIFTATEDKESGLEGSGRLTALDHNGNVLWQTFVYRPCAGGLSLADCDHDGVYELYMGDRDMYMGDGSARGVRSWWAENGSVRWNHADVLCSSQAPPLADVNGDGILDVIVSNQRGGVVVLDSRNGGAIRKDVRRDDLPTHYQGSVYDIDEDGNLEILFADGDHTNTPDDCAVFDLVDWTVDGRFDVGLCHYGPTVANVYGDERLEIIATNFTGIFIVDPETYEVMVEVTGLGGVGEKLQNAVVQDIDGDGLVELVVTSESGTVWAYDTEAAVPAQRARSEVQFYNERRTNAAVSTPRLGEEPEPIISGASPYDREESVPLSLSELRFTIKDNQGDEMDYTVTSYLGIASGSGTADSGEEIVVPITETLDYYTLYSWSVEATDGTHTTSRTFRFRTGFEPVANASPEHGDPLLDGGGGTSIDKLTCFNQSTSDDDGHAVANIYNWYVDDTSLTRLLLPANRRSATTSADYSGCANHAIVYGATWTSDGLVGGCYEFDGDDYLMIPHSSSLCGDGTSSEITVEHWIYFSENQDGSRTILKTRSYEIGFQSGRNNRIYAGVWTEESNDSQTSYYYLSRNTWHHVAMTYKDGEGVTLYVNGVARGFNSYPEGNIMASAGTRPETHEPLYIGSLDFFTGKIDEVRIYPRALSPEQIHQRYVETKDGISNNASIVWQETRPDELWKCKITPTDGYSDGLAKFSNTIGPLLNSPPTASDPGFPMRSRSDFALSSEDLETAYDYWDPDDDPESGSEIRWYKDLALQSAYNDLATLPLPATAAGEKWHFTVRPSDGDLFGSLETSPQVTIIDNAPPTHSNPVAESSSGMDRVGDEIICRNQSTLDTDPVTNTYSWYVDGVSFINLLLSCDTDAATCARDLSGYGNDGTVFGATWTSHGILGGAYTFDGDDVITVEDDQTLGGYGAWSEISLEFYVKLASPLHGTRIVGRMPEGEDTGTFTVGFQTALDEPYNTLFWGITILHNGRLQWIDTSNVENWDEIRDRLALETGNWYHVFCTYESGPGLTIYLNGTRMINMPLSGNIYPSDPDEMLYIGGPAENNFDRYLNGSLDEIRLYPRALSAEQVLQRFLDTKDGLSNSSTIVPQETAHGEDWKCQVTPSDSWQYGASRMSNTLTIDPIPCLVARGLNNMIYYRMYNTSTYSWEDWKVIPSGATCDSPAATVCSERLYIVVRGTDGSSIWFGSVDLTDNSFTGWRRLSGATNSAPTLTCNGSHLILLVRGMNNAIYYRFYDRASENWRNWNTISGGATCDSPAATVTEDNLHIVVRGYSSISVSGNQSIWHGILDLTDNSFQGWKRLPGATSSAPSLTASASSGEAYLTVRGLNNVTYVNTWDGIDWQGWEPLPGATSDSPAVTVARETLHIVVRGVAGTSLWHSYIDLTTSDHSGWSRITGATLSSPALTS